jgi:hypothetical protein
MLDAKIAARAYLRHLKEKPQDANRLFRACVDGFSTVPSSDKLWDAVQRLSQDLGTTKALEIADDFLYRRRCGDDAEEDQTAIPSHPTLGHTAATSVESQGGMNTRPNSTSYQISQFTAAHDEDVQSTGEDPLIPESLFSLAEVQQAINSFSNDGISFNELRNILQTDTPAIHAQSVRKALQKLDPCRVDIKILEALLEELQREESLAVPT